jgi:cyclopropane fatty-acyl-phospholipid synthase-like methyltransferase
LPDPPPSEIVRRGYDVIGERYTTAAAGELSPGRRHALATVAELVPGGARVLDIGCGAGVPMTAAMAERYVVHGIDISGEQTERARANVPQATFQRADVLDVDIAPGSYDAIVAFYSLIHVPRGSHAVLFERIRSWLQPSGVFVASFGVRDDPGTVEADWLGAPMYFSQFDRETTLELITAAGFDVLSATEVKEVEPGGTVTFLWVAARAGR